MHVECNTWIQMLKTVAVLIPYLNFNMPMQQS
jgi:hypothetical protein